MKLGNQANVTRPFPLWWGLKMSSLFTLCMLVKFCLPSLTEYTSSFTQQEEILTKIETTSQTVDRCVRETFIPLLLPCTADSWSQLVFSWFMVNTLVMFWFLLQVYQFVFLFPRNLRWHGVSCSSCKSCNLITSQQSHYYTGLASP